MTMISTSKLPCHVVANITSIVLVTVAQENTILIAVVWRTLIRFFKHLQGTYCGCDVV